MSTMMQNENPVVLITGAGSGIGLGIARAFARQGARVYLTDLHGEVVEREAGQLRQQSFLASGFACDVTLEAEVQRSVQRVIEAEQRLDVLVNSAGMQYIAAIEDFPAEKFQQLLNVMLLGPFLTMKSVLPQMKRQRFGRIIHIASINGLIGFAGKSAYNSAKHGLIGLTKVAALETAEQGITVNALCPGYVDTPLVRNQLQDLARSHNVPLERVLEEVIYPLVPQKRLLDVDEISRYVLFLAQKEAQGITGQAVVIDGGYTVQ